MVMMEKRILIVEDEQELQELLEYTLVKEGYLVTTAGKGSEVLNRIEAFKPDLVLLDLMLPELSGYELCRKIETDPNLRGLAVIILTAKGTETDRITGFELGADDYVTKPFSLKELILRIKSILSRTERGKGAILSVGGVIIDNQQHLVFKNGKKAYLTFAQFKILSTLAAHKGRVFSRHQLLDLVWGEDVIVSDRAVDVQIKRLKDRLRQELGAENLIQTVRGVGYKIEPQY